MTRWLAMSGLTYQDFQLRRRKMCIIKKAGVCSGGGFVQFKVRLMEGKDHPCPGCRQIVSEINFTPEDLGKVLSVDVVDDQGAEHDPEHEKPQEKPKRRRAMT